MFKLQFDKAINFPGITFNVVAAKNANIQGTPTRCPHCRNTLLKSMKVTNLDTGETKDFGNEKEVPKSVGDQKPYGNAYDIPTSDKPINYNYTGE